MQENTDGLQGSARKGLNPKAAAFKQSPMQIIQAHHDAIKKQEYLTGEIERLSKVLYQAQSYFAYISNTLQTAQEVASHASMVATKYPDLYTCWTANSTQLTMNAIAYDATRFTHDMGVVQSQLHYLVAERTANDIIIASSSEEYRASQEETVAAAAVMQSQKDKAAKKDDKKAAKKARIAESKKIQAEQAALDKLHSEEKMVEVEATKPTSKRKEPTKKEAMVASSDKTTPTKAHEKIADSRVITIDAQKTKASEQANEQKKKAAQAKAAKVAKKTKEVEEEALLTAAIKQATEEKEALLQATQQVTPKKVQHVANERVEQKVIIDARKESSSPQSLIYKLWIESINGNVEKALELLKYYPQINVNTQDKGGMTLLHILARSISPNQEIIKALLARQDIKVNIQNTEGNTALHFACQAGNEELVTILLARQDIDINAKNIIGVPALWVAFTTPYVESRKGLIKEFLNHKSLDVNIKDNRNEATILHLLCATANELVFDLLKLKDIEINAQDKIKNTALHYASAKGYTRAAFTLLNYKGIDVSIQDNDGHTAHDIAHSKGHTMISEIIRTIEIYLAKKASAHETAAASAIADDDFTSSYASEKDHKSIPTENDYTQQLLGDF